MENETIETVVEVDYASILKEAAIKAAAGAIITIAVTELGTYLVNRAKRRLNNKTALAQNTTEE